MLHGRHWIPGLAIATMAAAPRCAPSQEVLFHSPAFEVSTNRVRQGPFDAVAQSRDTITSNYPRAAREVHFKFALGGADNEFPPGIEHTIHLRPQGGAVATPLYAFAVPPQPFLPRAEDSAEGEDAAARVTIRLDLRAVRRAIAERGYYDPPLGARVRAIEPVFVIGDTDPLVWDVRQLKPGAPQELTDRDGDGIYEATLSFRPEYLRPLSADGRAIWSRRVDLSAYPAMTSPHVLADALYRLSLEELHELRRSDGALAAGAKWPGVWTRDVALSTVLALAFVAPDAARTSLMMKVDSAGRIIQDTGTGGSWPISTDRMTWALAAWEVYAMTGDHDWLRQAYDIIRRSAEADRHAAFDARTGLMRGESSFLDWREQSYPRWMQPADIYQSEALGTNAVHYGAFRVLGAMARALGESSAVWDARAGAVRSGMAATLWQPALGWHAQFRYGRVSLSRSPSAEALGEALALVTGATPSAQRARVLGAFPLMPFGTPTIWPFIADVPFYHNATIWPFVTAYWTWAAADAQATAAVEHGLAAMARGAALFLTNKENMVAATGHFEGTALNSDRQLWSVAGTLAMSYRVLFGMRAEERRLAFRPMVPPAYGGERTLRGVRYRSAELTVTVLGHGTGVARAWLDERPVPRAEVLATTSGSHTLVIEMDGRWPASRINLVEARVAPATPVAALDTAALRLEWPAVARASRYVVYRDGRAIDTVSATAVPVTARSTLAEYQVQALDRAGVGSFLSEPVRVIAAGAERFLRPAGARDTALRLERGRPARVAFEVTVRRGGRFALDARYANGSGPINTEDKAAVRTLQLDGRTAGVLVMPQRGSGRWDDWGYTNPLILSLRPGRHVLSLEWTPLDENMNRHVSTALLQQLRVTPLP
ncbi:MAG: glycogen debranching protein [Gemmatimonadetes bacterium]|nr:glycogen debranching protein [Gemmatimonadota bacterium]